MSDPTTEDQPVETPATVAPASAAAFRQLQDDGAYLELPDSGLVVRVKRATIAELAYGGAIPDSLSAYVMARLGQPDAALQEQDRDKPLRERLEPNMRLIDTVCCAVLVEPRMVPADKRRTAEQVHPADLSYRDREHIYLYACRLVEEATGLRRFPGGPGGGVGPVADGVDVQGAAE